MLTDRVVVVTGGAGLLGTAFARAIAEQGATAVIATRDQENAAKVRDEIEGGGVRGAVALQALDITDEASVTGAFSALHDTYGRIDAVVNNALPRNANYGRKLEDVTLADFVQNVGSHLGGYFVVCREAVKYFTRQGHGTIVNLGSIYGVVAPRFELYSGTSMTKEIEYFVSKAAIVEMTAYLAAYCKGRNIRVNSLSPGGVLDGQPEPFVTRYNEQCLSKGMLAPEDVVGTLLFLLSGASRYVNGQNIVVDDGFVL